jgi:hypothetical protein
MKMTFKTTAAALTFSALLAAPAARAAVTLTYVENPGAVNSTLKGTTVYNFDAAGQQGAGVYNNLNWAGVGSINQVYLQNDNLYGGATGQGVYPVQSEGPGGVGGNQAVETTTLTLNQPSSYFGLWWSAGDAANTLSFYNGNTLVAQFNTQSILDTLPRSYYGNPVSAFQGADAGEPFAFLNVYGGPGVSWNKVVFSNPSGSGFESDNWTVRSQGWGALAGENGAAPGVQVATVSGTRVSLTPAPEPSFTVAGLVGAATVLVAVRTRRQNQAAKAA